MVSEAVSKGDIAALNYFVAEKYLHAFGEIAKAPNQKIVLLPMEATGILGSLAGITELARETFGPSRPGPSVPSAGRASGPDRA
jgi:hypothetical protein